MTSYRYLGYGVTNSNGVAHLDHDPQGNPINGYTGTGAGEVDVIASTDNPISSGSIVSETYEVLDCLYIDKCTSDDHANWNNTTGFSWSDGKCTITASSSIFPRITTALTGDFEAVFYASMTSAIRLIVYDSSNVSSQNKWIMNASGTLTDEYLYRIKRVDGDWTVQHSTDDGATWSSAYSKSSGSLTTESVYLGFGIETSSSRSITYTDLKVYPI